MEGFDVKAALDQAIAYAAQHYLLVLAVLAGLLLLSKGTSTAIRNAVVKALTDNWQLTLLASTGVALSVASAYTTFDGLRNFTNAPLLSVAIAFGIQGVMLIVAWLIGESFATGMNTQSAAAGGRTVKRLDAIIGAFLGLMLTGLVFYWLLSATNAVRISSLTGVTADWARIADVSVYYLIGVLALGLIVFGAMRGHELAAPYMQSIRLMVKNAVLWVMFLAAMSASVFFSFDSHFNAIFPQEQRARASEIRATSQVGGVVSDIGALTQRRQLEEAERLFETDGWKAYERQLVALAQAAHGAQGEIERYFVQKIEERRRAIAQQQERIATAQSGQAGLANKKVSLSEELARLKAERPALAADYAQHQGELDAKAREIDGKRVEAMAEERGVEGTLKQGRGQIYRQRMGELAALQDQFKIKQERTNDAKKRLVTLETRLSQVERELSGIDGELAKMKGEAETAEQRIRAAQVIDADDEGLKFDPARVLPAFEKARTTFRQQPTVEHLAGVQAQCTNLLNAMSATQVTKERVRAIDCDPKQAAEAAGRVFALNSGVAAFQANCAGGDKLARLTTTDALLGFGRRCLQDSGLVSKDSADIGARLSGIDMNRDDKAHRFVVTWNAFLDGNRLAYLSLILAIGVDGLVFMSGLFGAQALRSPLSDVPSPKARSAHQLEAIIEASLLPDTFKKARTALEAMHPMAAVDGFTNVVHMGELDPETQIAVRDLLNAGATIGAVRQAREREVYLVRAELYEFLAHVIRREMKSHPEETRRGLELDRLESRLREALLPHVGETADAVLSYMHPIEEKHGFTSEIRFDEVERPHVRPVRNALTAGISLRVAQRDAHENHYFLRPEFYQTLSRIRARELLAGRQSHARGQIAYGGALDGGGLQLAHSNQARVAIPPPLMSNGRAASALAVPPPLPAAAQRAQATPPPLPASRAAAAREDMQATFLAHLRMSPGALEKLADPEVARAALHAADALKRLALSNRNLRSCLEENFEPSCKMAVKNAFEELVERYGDEHDLVSVLAEVREEIAQRLPALMLLPEGGLLDVLVGELENGAADDGLDRSESALLDRLREMMREIDHMDAGNASHWRNLQRKAEGQASHTAMPQHALNGAPPLTKH